MWHRSADVIQSSQRAAFLEWNPSQDTACRQSHIPTRSCTEGTNLLLSVSCITDFIVIMQASRAGEVKFSILRFVTVGVVSSTVEELIISMMDTPFTVLYHDPILPTAECQEHYAIVSQSRELVPTGSYVQLYKPVYQVCVYIHVHIN